MIGSPCTIFSLVCTRQITHCCAHATTRFIVWINRHHVDGQKLSDASGTCLHANCSYCIEDIRHTPNLLRTLLAMCACPSHIFRTDSDLRQVSALLQTCCDTHPGNVTMLIHTLPFRLVHPAGITSSEFSSPSYCKHSITQCVECPTLQRMLLSLLCRPD
jgi:hypothetical protein